jgi:hypothetical protein
MGIAYLLLLGIALIGVAGQKQAPPAACQDEEAMVTDYEKGLQDLVGTVKKETLADFERTYHRKSCLTKLNLCVTVLDGAVACLDKAAQDSSTPKAQAGAYAAKRDGYAKLKEKVGHYRDSLKTTEAGKDAKALIEKFDFAE